MHELTMKLCEMIAIGLGKDRHFFREWFEKDSMSTLRSVHLLPRSSNIVDSSKLDRETFKLTTPEHADSGFITLLSTLGYPGLQVNINGEFKSVKPIYNQMVVNLGGILERITNYQLKATLHRVLDIGIERFSCPFLATPSYLTEIPSNLLKPAE